MVHTFMHKLLEYLQSWNIWRGLCFKMAAKSVTQKKTEKWRI